MAPVAAQRAAHATRWRFGWKPKEGVTLAPAGNTKELPTHVGRMQTDAALSTAHRHTVVSLASVLPAWASQLR